MIIAEIRKFLDETAQKGGIKGVHYNAIVIPINLTDQFEKETEDLLAQKSEDIKDHRLFDLEILISGENDKIRLAKVF